MRKNEGRDVPVLGRELADLDVQSQDEFTRVDTTPRTTNEWPGDVLYYWISQPGFLQAGTSIPVVPPQTGQLVSCMITFESVGTNDVTIDLLKNGSSSQTWTLSPTDTSPWQAIINPRVAVDQNQDVFSVDVTDNGAGAAYWVNLSVRLGVGTFNALAWSPDP